jgi:hypothetical protein
MKYIILTNKEAFRTAVQGDGLEPVASYDYYFFGRLKANYTIVKVTDEHCKVAITENGDVPYVNHIPVKFFEAFDCVEDAYKELQELVGPDSENQKLVKVS